jgi:protein SCO1/2
MFKNIFISCIKHIVPVFIIFILCNAIFAEDLPPKKEIGFDEKLGETIPLNLNFIDEYGKPVILKEVFSKPTIFTLVYFRCPGICSPLLTGVADAIDRLDMEAGKDFNIVTISFEPGDTYLTAAEKKNNYLETMDKKIPVDSWRFLTGDSAAIAQITDAVGFRYLPQGRDYMHAAGIMAISKDGKIARYLYGTEFNPIDMKMSIIEAAEGRTGPTIATLMKLCYSYDPEGKKYVMNITRIAGSGMILLLGVFIAVLIIKKKRKNIPENIQERDVK